SPAPLQRPTPQQRSMRRLLLAGTLLVLSLGGALWARTLSLSMRGLDGDADEWARQQIGQSVAMGISPDVSASERDGRLERGVDEWTAGNPTEFEKLRRAAAEQLNADRRYTGTDGREYTYLGDLDSYLWLRRAQTYLDRGTTCDAVVDGVCRDRFTLAPVG